MEMAYDDNPESSQSSYGGGNGAGYFYRDLEVDEDTTVMIPQNMVGDVGCVVWDAALVLAKFLQHQRIALQGASVLELGSGTGCVGVFAAVLGSHVIVTDLWEYLPLMEKCIAVNDAILFGSCQAKVLRWGKDLPDFAKVDWDYVLISDCVYYKDSFQPLLDTLAQLIKGKTIAFVSMEWRDDKVALQTDFMSHVMAKYKFTKYYKADHHPDFAADDIFVFKLEAKQE